MELASDFTAALTGRAARLMPIFKARRRALPLASSSDGPRSTRTSALTTVHPTAGDGANRLVGLPVRVNAVDFVGDARAGVGKPVLGSKGGKLAYAYRGRLLCLRPAQAVAPVPAQVFQRTP